MDKLAPATPVRVLVANEPPAYRETISLALAKLRPRAHVIQGDPDDIEVALSRERPHVVICSRYVPALDTALGWAMLHPVDGGPSTISADGVLAHRPDVSFDDLLALIDRVADHLHESCVGS